MSSGIAASENNSGNPEYAVPEEILAGNKAIFHHKTDKWTVWVKQRRPGNNVSLRKAQRLLYRMTELLLLLPPDIPEEDSVRFETARLREAAAKGIRVPEILLQTDRYFVMTDTGPHLEQFLKENPSRRDEFVERAAQELRRFHLAGLAHGGAQIKNMTVRDDALYFIDLEEKIPDDSLELFQLRDLFLFLLSLERTGNDPDIERICQAYGGDGATEAQKWVVESIRQLRALRFFNSRLFALFTMRDIRGILRLVDKAERMHPSRMAYVVPAASGK